MIKSFFQNKLILTLLFATSLNLVSLAQGFLKTDGQRIVNDKGENVLLRGIGLGGWMLQEGYMLRVNQNGQQHKIRERIDSLIGPERTEEFYEAWLSNHTTKKDIDSLKAWGFNSVRLPMHYNLYTLPVEKEPVAGQNTWMNKGFALTDSLLKWCKANKIYLILDLHAAPGGQGNDLNISDADTSKPFLWQSEANQKKTVALWRKLAERYVNESWIGAYDILNEPNWGFTDPVNDKNGLKEEVNAPLKKLLVEITQAIREVDRKHIVIIEGNGWGNNYKGMLPPWDDNMVLSFHKYWNRNDQNSIQHLIDARNKYNVPVWLGETGENSNVWFTQAIELLERNNIGWAWWPLKKMGANNPLEIKSNLNYDQVLRYWSGRGNKPNESNAYSGLLELAIYTRLEANIFHRDVIDAMMRQPHSSETKPYKNQLPSNSGYIKAVDYDLGRNGYAYFDQDTADYRVSGIRGVGNRGRMYRNDGVDILKDSSEYESYFVSEIETGEWLQYSINVKTKGLYSFELEVSSDSSDCAVSILIHDILQAKQLISNGGSLKKWKKITMKNIPLEKGLQKIRIRAEKGGFSLKAILFNLQK